MLIELGQLRVLVYGILIIVLFLWILRGVIPTLGDLLRPKEALPEGGSDNPIESDVAHLGYVELFTPTFDESLRFFTDVLSMDVVESVDDTAFLRAWDDYERFSLMLTARSEAGIGRVGVRASDDQALRRRVEEIESSGLGQGWVDGQPGRGATSFSDPDGHAVGPLLRVGAVHAFEIGDTSSGRTSPNAAPTTGSAFAVWTMSTSWRPMWRAAETRGVRAGRPANRADPARLRRHRRDLDDLHQQGLRRGLHQRLDQDTGRLHHVAFAVDQREDILRGADIFLEHGVFIETGPHKHAIQQTFFLYVWEPGGTGWRS